MPPNLVLIMCDQQLREHLGCYGSTYGVTPNLDRLAAEGLTFENAYTASPVCTPARGALFTGRTPHRCGAYSNELPLYETVPTMGEVFARRGYRTGYIGKWHLDGGGYMGSGRAARGFPDAVWYDGQRYLDELAPAERELGYGSCDNATLRARDLPDDLCWATWSTNRAVDFIGRHAGQADPFLLVVSYDEPHPPAICPARYLDAVREANVVVPETLGDGLEGKPATHRKWQAADVRQYGVNAETMREGICRYLACNAYVDAEIGRVLDAVDAHCRNETVVLYTTDHGDFMGQFSFTGKGAAMYEAITGVPLLVRAPGRTRPGSRTKALASTLDCIPTMLGLGGLAEDTPLDGTSLVAAWTIRPPRCGRRSSSSSTATASRIPSPAVSGRSSASGQRAGNSPSTASIPTSSTISKLIPASAAIESTTRPAPRSGMNSTTGCSGISTASRIPSAAIAGRDALGGPTRPSTSPSHEPTETHEQHHEHKDDESENMDARAGFDTAGGGPAPPAGPARIGPRARDECGGGIRTPRVAGLGVQDLAAQLCRGRSHRRRPGD